MSLIETLAKVVVILKQWLKEIRESKRMTQEVVAEKAGISRAHYANIENGQRCEPGKCDTEKKIAAALGFNWTKFFEEETA